MNNIENVGKPVDSDSKNYLLNNGGIINAPIELCQFHKYLVDRWTEVFNNNYKGVSAEVLSLPSTLKENYKGNKYIPWATIERLARLQDPTLVLVPILNNEGGLIHTDKIEFEQAQENMNGTNTTKISTKSVNYSHTVWIRCIFIGREFIEYFPIQDNSYEPVRFPNQNEVNKAIQRAKAKVLSRATGIGLSLYETGDLQFEDDINLNKVKEEPKAVKKAKESVTKKQDTAKEEPKNIETKTNNTIASYTGCFMEEIVNKYPKEKVLEILQKFNTTLIQAYSVSITEEDLSNDVLLQTKLEKIPNVEQLIKTISKRLEV